MLEGHTDGKLRRYLLGELPGPEAEALEAGYVADPELVERIREAETDLVDDYAAGLLEGEDLRAFEGHYLASAAHRARVAVARALVRAAAARAPEAPRRRSRPRLGAALAAAAVLSAVTAGVWLVRGGVAPRPAPSPAVTAAAPAVPPHAAPRPAPVVVAFAVSPLRLRGAGGLPALRLPPGADDVELRLEGEVAPRGALRFELRTAGGEAVASGPARPGTSPRAVAVLTVPAARLAADDYLVTLEGDAGDVPLRYAFRVLP
ncbi:MAG: hypothetical protein QM704_23335 [Anaeromyxobacteraceae bacterium]